MSSTPAATAPQTFLTRPSGLFVATVFTSAFLVFFVQPMVGKLLLPMLGGAPAVWNTTMAFFQAALLAGYGYAHLLQKLKALRHQVIVHGVMLVLAGLTLPLHITGLLGDPNPERPVLWLLGVLTLSIGAPFAVLSATAPLIQAWFARTALPDPETGRAPEPYSLYAASNLGSLISLLAYPVIVEPLTRLSDQRLGWSLGYAALAVMIVSLGILLRRKSETQTENLPATPRPTYLTMAKWVGLAAVPSSLMIGVTTYLTTDVASAPFLWIVPLALYLLTFILAFSTRQILSPRYLLYGHVGALCVCLYLMPVASNILLSMGVHLLAFFMTAWMCHNALAQARPAPDHLTLYYLCLSLGGVVGGGFNAFLAPVIFPTIIEYVLVLALACLARPWGQGYPRRDILWLVVGLVASLSLAILVWTARGGEVFNLSGKFLFSIAVVSIFALNHRGLWMGIVAVAAGLALHLVLNPGYQERSSRNFFGVVRVGDYTDISVGPLREMIHGTTLHGAQRLQGDRCQPLTYYGPKTSIGQAFTLQQNRKYALNMATVGLGVGTVSTYVRATDRMTFYEIDPAVMALARDPKLFTFVSDCAKGPVDFTLGDARLTLARTPERQLDVLLVDAFSSDAVPAHLLTAEAIGMYLSKLSDDGVVILHLSNRHLALTEPVIAAVRTAGGVSLTQISLSDPNRSRERTGTVVVVAARDRAALEPFRADPRWEIRGPGETRAWTDDYMNIVGALLSPPD